MTPFVLADFGDGALDFVGEGDFSIALSNGFCVRRGCGGFEYVGIRGGEDGWG